MAKIWVKLNVIKEVEVSGRRERRYPGDWVEVGKHDARKWVECGDAEIVNLKIKQAVLDFTHCAVALSGPNLKAREKDLRSRFGDGLEVGVANDTPLPQPKTLLWDTSARLRTELISVGFHQLDRWQICVPLIDMETLASDIGTAEDRELTAALLPDLRVPVYDPRVLFVRRCDDTRRLLELWQSEGGSDSRLAFLRALYRVKPLLLALPPLWVK